MQYPNPLIGPRAENKELNHQERAKGLPVITSYPLVAKLEVTTRCNLRCTMCSVSYRKEGDNGEHMDFALFQKLQPIFPYLICCYLYGIGEPLLHPRLMDMFTLLSEAGVNVGFITNGILIDEGRARKWIEQSLYKLSISLDGATKETYEAIRRWGDFDKLMQNLKLVKELKEEYQSPFPIMTLNYVVMKNNLHELLPLIELAGQLNANEVIVTELVPFVDSVKDQVLSYDNPDLHKTYERAEIFAAEFGVRLVLPNSYIRWRQKNKKYALQPQSDESKVAGGSFGADDGQNVLEDFERNIHNIPFAKCTEPWSGFWMSQSGQVDPCCYWFKSMGGLTSETFEDIWNGKSYQHLRQTVNDPNRRSLQCQKCPVPS